MNWPNLLTLLRIATIPFILILLYTNHFMYAASLFLFASLLDAVDGILARKLNQVTDFGKLMDPIADKILILSILICLVDLKLAQALPIILIAAREFFISGWRMHKASSGKVVSASMAGKIKTVVQVIAVLWLILRLPFEVEMLWFAAFMSLYSGVEYIGRSEAR